MNPFLTLNLPWECTDEDVRHAYKDMLRRYPPESHPEQFQMIQEAFAALRTEQDRWRWIVWNEVDPQEGFLDSTKEFALLPGRRRPPGAEPFRHFLQACTDAARKGASKS